MITLQKVDESNFIPCFDLELNDWQKEFVSHPIRSLAQAYVYYKQCTPFAVLSGGEVVGYIMVIYDYDEETYNIWHLMIDRRICLQINCRAYHLPRQHPLIRNSAQVVHTL